MVLITGPTGSGKSTTLASMLDRINSSRQSHIMTIEDPIEYIHHHKKCIVNQREVGADTDSFPKALKYVLRQDPDVILIGEMRDLETIEAALTIAETGHLVFATLHTNSTYEAVNRIVDVFPADQQKQILTQLAFTLEGVVTQQLIPRSRGSGRVMAAEVLMCTPAIKAVIREGKIHQIYSLMQAGQKYGMQTMNQALLQAVLDKHLNPEDAIERSTDRPELENMISKVGRMAA
jgi:twitching motility protein PilT